MGYQPLTLARLGELLASCAESERWLLIAEFRQEHRHEPRPRRLELLQEEPTPTSDQRWDVFLRAPDEVLAVCTAGSETGAPAARRAVPGKLALNTLSRACQHGMFAVPSTERS